MSTAADIRSKRVDLRTAPVVFKPDAKRWDAFMAALVKPPKNSPRLRKLLGRRPTWKASAARRRALGLGMKAASFLKEGDVVTLRIEGLGEQRQRVVKGKRLAV